MSCLRICLSLFLLLFSCHFSWAAGVNFSWLANSESDVAGYRLYYGDGSRDYTDFIDINPDPVEGRIYGALSGLDEDRTYFFAVTAYTLTGDESDFSREIVYCIGCYSTGLPHLESGEVILNHNWARVEFGSTYNQPVIVARIVSYNDADPCVVRIRNVDSTGFDIKIQEWDYLDGIHTQEVVSYLVMEKGRYALQDGSSIEAGIFETTGILSFKQQEFDSVFNMSPVVVASVRSYNGVQAVTTRIKTIERTGFQYMMQEEQANDGTHIQETISYIAWERSDGNEDGVTYSVGVTGDRIEKDFTWSGYRERDRTAFKAPPFVVAGMQTTNGADPAALRFKNNSITGLFVKVEEEQSFDSEVAHAAENVGYIAVMDD